MGTRIEFAAQLVLAAWPTCFGPEPRCFRHRGTTGPVVEVLCCALELLQTRRIPDRRLVGFCMRRDDNVPFEGSSLERTLAGKSP